MKNDELIESRDTEFLPKQDNGDSWSEFSDDNEPTEKRLAIRRPASEPATLPSTPSVAVGNWDISHTPPLEDEAEARVTLPLPAFHLRYIVPQSRDNDVRARLKGHAQERELATQSKQQRKSRLLFQDKWLTAVFVTAAIAGSLSLWYFFAQHQTLLYGDANAHLLIARRIFDNVTPGLAQLGAIWLPLPHLLMVPFVWNDYLWRTGLAGSIVSLVSYVIASMYIFLSARRLTNNNAASFVGTLVFVLNPNILYLQSTPLSELVLIATFTAACYYFLVWAQTNSTKYLILAAGATFLATLSRYDGWALFLVCLVLIALIGWLRHHKWAPIEGHLIIYGSMGGLGIALWFLWNLFIFGDPLYFQRGPFSAQAQQKDLINAHLLYTYHDILQSVRYYVIDCIDIVGPILFAVGVIAFIVFVVRRRFTAEMFAALAFLVPIPFYISSLYSGQASLYLPTAVPGYAPYQLFNARYGEGIVIPVAIFSAFLLASLVSLAPIARSSLHLPTVAARISHSVAHAIVPIAGVGIILAQTLLLTNGGIITLQDGQYGLACTPTHTIVIYLAQHYNGGRILEDLYTAKIDTLEPTAGIDFKNMVYEGSGQLWTEALQQPQRVVDWIIVNPNNPQDTIGQKVSLNSPAFTSQFSFVLQETNGLTLYHRNGLPPLPLHPVTRSVFTEHQLCGTYNPASASVSGQQVVFTKKIGLS